MTAPVTHTFSDPVYPTGPWATWWRAWYRFVRLLGAPLTRLVLARGFGNVVVMYVRGRHSGAERTVLLGLLSVKDKHYVGHPNGDTSWTLNLRDATSVRLTSKSLGTIRARPVVLAPSPERDAVVRATFRQHPFPGNAFYRLAADHVMGHGVFFRLDGPA